MSEVPAWFERKFSFPFPVEVYPNLRGRLAGTPARLEEMLQGLSRAPLTAKLGGKWSIQENAGHLLDLEPLWLARVEEFLRGAGVLTEADLTNRKTHEAGHNQRPLAEILGAFRRARSRLVDRLHGPRAEEFARTSLHPRLKTPMRLVDLMFFVAEHDDHHLARIWELRHALND
ncbi:MAG: DinB family protein [Terriglobia bacterium]